MAKDPAERFQTADEMLAAIRAAQSGPLEAPTREPAADAAAVADRGDAQLAKARTKRKPLSLAVKMFLGLAAVALIAVAYALVAFNNWITLPEVPVPDVAGKTQIEAQALLADVGLNLKVSGEKYDNAVPAGTVISQSPLGGEKAKKGRDVWCLLSKGQDYAKVPDVMGKPYPRQVLVDFENAGVRVGEVTYTNHPTIPKDQVISQKVPAGLDVPRETPIDLVVSSGPEPTGVKVPPLTGMNQANVKEALTAQLLDLGVVVYQQSSSAAAGTVLSQNPAAGEEVPLRTKVNIVVAGEAPALTHEHTKKFYPKDMVVDGKPTRVIISVKDSRGQDIVVYDRTVLPTDPEQTVLFEWQGSQATVTTNRGGKISTETIRP
jgi:serine/threonine-protein kinase